MELDTCKEAYPLNSRCLSISQIHQLAQALEVPTVGSSDDLHVMIEGKLKEMNHDLVNVQVVIKETPGGYPCLELQDESGPFLEIPIPDHSKVSIPVCSKASTPERCLSLVSSQGSEFTDANQSEDKLYSDLKKSLECANSKICFLKQLIEEQRLALTELKTYFQLQRTQLQS